MPHLLNKRRALCLLTAPAALASAAAHAHVKWFVPLDGSTGLPAPDFSFTEPAVQLWLVTALLVVAASVWLDRKLPAPPLPRRDLRTLFDACLPVLLGLSLLLSWEAGSVIAPHYQPDGAYAAVLLALELGAGLLLIFPPTTFAGGLVLFFLYGGLLINYGPRDALEYFNVAGLAVYLLCMFHPLSRMRAMLEPFALPLLRITTGIALVTLGFAEKLLNPGYAEEFLQTYRWNFMYNLGADQYSDRLFVLSAGVMEVVFGVILILGTTTRLNIIAVSGFMLSSNITFLFQGHLREAVTEIIGHLPLIATALLFVFFGSGERLRTGNLFQRRTQVYSSA